MKKRKWQLYIEQMQFDFSEVRVLGYKYLLRVNRVLKAQDNLVDCAPKHFVEGDAVCRWFDLGFPIRDLSDLIQSEQDLIDHINEEEKRKHVLTPRLRSIRMHAQRLYKLLLRAEEHANEAVRT